LAQCNEKLKRDIGLYYWTSDLHCGDWGEAEGEDSKKEGRGIRRILGEKYEAEEIRTGEEK
jgi:hypothetical protein